jgi:hypothetical protein
MRVCEMQTQFFGEVRQSDGDLRRLAARLSAYEQQYGMTSSEAYWRFCAGELGDDRDFVEWGIFWEMYRATEKLGSQR